jgi:hypothetical protein
MAPLIKTELNPLCQFSDVRVRLAVGGFIYY